MKLIKLKKSATFAIVTVALLLVLSINVNAASNVYSWYCKRTKDHTQPPLPSEFEFISSYGGFYIDIKNSSHDAEDKKIYLTFDAGYENGNIEKTLDILKRQNVTGAFFILGNLVKSNPDLVCRMFDEGHLVCNHTYSHKAMVGKSKDVLADDLNTLKNVCRETVGREISDYYRPPEGRFDEASLNYASELGYKTIFWSFAYADWDNNKQMSPEKAKKKILDNVHNGEIMLLHPTSATNATILEDVIVTLKSQGYRFGTLDELCGR